MAITLRLDDAQAEALIKSVDDLSNNLAKWQAHQAVVLDAGFKALIVLLGGDDADQTQVRIDEFTSQIKSSTDALDAAVKANQLPEQES